MLSRNENDLKETTLAETTTMLPIATDGGAEHPLQVAHPSTMPDGAAVVVEVDHESRAQKKWKVNTEPQSSFLAQKWSNPMSSLEMPMP
jgi:hypothetical protein